MRAGIVDEHLRFTPPDFKDFDLGLALRGSGKSSPSAPPGAPMAVAGPMLVSVAPHPPGHQQRDHSCALQTKSALPWDPTTPVCRRPMAA